MFDPANPRVGAISLIIIRESLLRNFEEGVMAIPPFAHHCIDKMPKGHSVMAVEEQEELIANRKTKI